MAQSWPWEDSSLDEMELAYRRMRAMFEFLDKLGAEYWCFHDRCIASLCLRPVLTLYNAWAQMLHMMRAAVLLPARVSACRGLGLQECYRGFGKMYNKFQAHRMSCTAMLPCWGGDLCGTQGSSSRY